MVRVKYQNFFDTLGLTLSILRGLLLGDPLFKRMPSGSLISITVLLALYFSFLLPPPHIDHHQLGSCSSSCSFGVSNTKRGLKQFDTRRVKDNIINTGLPHSTPDFQPDSKASLKASLNHVRKRIRD